MVHVPRPGHQVAGARSQRRRRDDDHQNIHDGARGNGKFNRQTQPEPCEHGHRQNDLANRVHLADHQGLHPGRTGEHPQQQRAADNQGVPGNHQKHDPQRQMAETAEHQKDADQHHFVGDRIEIGAEGGILLQPLGEVSVHRVGDRGGDEQPERRREIAAHDQINDDRHRQQARHRNDVGKAHSTAAGCGLRPWSGADPKRRTQDRGSRLRVRSRWARARISCSSAPR